MGSVTNCRAASVCSGTPPGSTALRRTTFVGAAALWARYPRILRACSRASSTSAGCDARCAPHEGSLELSRHVPEDRCTEAQDPRQDREDRVTGFLDACRLREKGLDLIERFEPIIVGRDRRLRRGPAAQNGGTFGGHERLRDLVRPRGCLAFTARCGGHRDAACADRHLVTARRVGRVSQLVDLEIALALEALLGRGEQDGTIDDGLFDAVAAELVRTVWDVGREEAHRADILHDRRELEDLRTHPRRLHDLVEEHRDRVDRHALRAHGLDALLHHQQIPFDEDIWLWNEHDGDHTALELGVEIPSQPTCGRAQAFLGLLEREQDPLLARSSAAVEKLEEHDRLAGPGRTRDQQARPSRDAIAQELIERRDPGFQTRCRNVRASVALDGDARRKHFDASRRDAERELVAAMVGTAHLDDLEEPLLLSGLFALRELQQAVDDGEHGVRRHVARTVFAEEDRGRLPGHQLHRELVGELALLLSRFRQIVEHFEAVDDDDRRLELLDLLHDQLRRFLEALAPQDHSEVDELDVACFDLCAVEEIELAEVEQGLCGRLRERAEPERPLLGSSVVEADLLRQNRLAGAGRAAEDADRAFGEPTMKQGVEVANAGFDPWESRLLHHAGSSMR